MNSAADWKLRKGDVLRNAHGTERVVRAVAYSKSGKLWGVAFAIMRCSWTSRCYTWLTANDLNTFGYSRTRKRLKLRTRLDSDIANCLRDENRMPDKQYLHCCDVVGVVR